MSEKLLTPTQLFTIPAPDDLNNVSPGIYWVGQATQNGPEYGYVFSLKVDSIEESAPLIAQIFIGIGGLQTRESFSPNKWTNWSKV